MVLVETRSTWVDDNCHTQPWELPPNQSRELRADDRLLGKTQRRADQDIGASARSLLNQPPCHRTRSQVRTRKSDEVPAFAETVQHVLLLLFWVAQIVKADDGALIEIDTCICGRKLHRTDARMDLDLKTLEG